MPLLMIFLRSNWKILLIGGIVLLWSIGCYNQGARKIQQKWDKSILEATLQARGIEHDNAVLSNIVEGKYETGIKAIDDSYNTALRSLQPDTSGNMPAKSSAASKPDVTACDNRLYRANKQKLLEIGRQADINTQKLLLLQEWEQSIK